ncbi:hypothetical protein BJV74DRAFT_325395 [Russula compacta]|nr:hypothetical protein BJV74DRAFT_325395 [Russula compacta]
MPPLKPPRLPSPLAIRASTRSSGRPRDRIRVCEEPSRSLSHHPFSSSSSLSSLSSSRPILDLPLPFALRFFPLLPLLFSNPRPEPPPRSLPYGSGRSAKEMRFGVERALDPELPAAPVLRPGVRKPSDEAGLCGVRKPPFSAEGRGSRLDDPECMWTGLVNRRETLAVAVDVPSVGAGKGVRGRKAGRRDARPSDDARDMADAFCWSSQILRKA